MIGVKSEEVRHLVEDREVDVLAQGRFERKVATEIPLRIQTDSLRRKYLRFICGYLANKSMR